MIDAMPGAWAATGGQAPFELRHELASDPRLSVDAIVELADRLPLAAIETTTGSLPPDYGGDVAPPVEGDPGSLIRAMAAGERGWMAIKHIEEDAGYRALVDDGLAAAASRLGLPPRVGPSEGYLFISSGGSTTPAHVDHEHNLLLQVLGTKTVVIGTFPDDASEAQVMESMHSGGYGRTGFPPHDPTSFALRSGTGVYIPPRGVHLVDCGDSLSISLSLVFHTAELERAVRIYAANARLRRLRLRPRPPGRSAVADRAKSGAVQLVQRLKSSR